MAETNPASKDDMTANSGQFQKGNTLRLTHGGRSRQVRQSYRKDLTVSMREHVLATLPELSPADMMLVDLLVVALVDVRQLDEWIDKQGGPVSVQGQTYKCMDMRRSRERDALTILRELGVGPKARAGLVATLGNRRTGLATQLAQERARLEAAGVMSPLQ
jgi:hypothetical protein